MSRSATTSRYEARQRAKRLHPDVSMASFGYNSEATVPFALNEARDWVLAVDGFDTSRLFLCPFCNGEVRARRATRVKNATSTTESKRYTTQPHWCHRRNTCAESHQWLRGTRSRHDHKGGGETELHHLTKRYLHLQTDAWLRGRASAPIIHYLCSSPECSEVVEIESLSLAAATAVLEHRLPNGLRLDVALLDDTGDVQFALEAFVSNAVTPRKKDRLSIPWIEIDALDYNPSVWLVRQSSRPPRRCPKCEARHLERTARLAALRNSSEMQEFLEAELAHRLANFRAATELGVTTRRRHAAQQRTLHEAMLPAQEARLRVRQVADQLGIDIVPGLKAHLWYCHRCVAPMLVFAWAGRRVGAGPPTSVKTLHFDDEHGWQEHCPHCDEPQKFQWYSRHELPRLLDTLEVVTVDGLQASASVDNQ